jgi:hypothetical protein
MIPEGPRLKETSFRIHRYNEEHLDLRQGGESRRVVVHRKPRLRIRRAGEGMRYYGDTGTSV